jgi:hypothetical protein
LGWPTEPKVVAQGEILALGLVLENVGAEPVEFVNGFLELLVRLTDEQGNDVKTDGLLNFRKLPRIQYHLDPGDALDVEVRVPLSPEDQRSLPVGRYTAVVREYEGSGSFNSVLTSAGVDPPAPLVIVIH